MSLEYSSYVNLLGNVCLNIAFVLYLIVYIPQILHNKQANNLSGLSLWLHFLLYISYFLDVLYAFASNLPWQYKIVSIASIIPIVIQHLQLLKYFQKRDLLLLERTSFIFFILSIIATLYIFNQIMHNELSIRHIIFIGITSRIAGLIYFIPQILKNKSIKSTKGISAHFIYLSFFLVILDSISAWCLNWGWILKISSPLVVFLIFII